MNWTPNSGDLPRNTHKYLAYDTPTGPWRVRGFSTGTTSFHNGCKAAAPQHLVGGCRRPKMSRREVYPLILNLNVTLLHCYIVTLLHVTLLHITRYIHLKLHVTNPKVLLQMLHRTDFNVACYILFLLEGRYTGTPLLMFSDACSARRLQLVDWRARCHRLFMHRRVHISVCSVIEAGGPSGCPGRHRQEMPRRTFKSTSTFSLRHVLHAIYL